MNGKLSTYKDLTNIIHLTALESIPRKKHRRHDKPPTPWWDQECDEAIQSRREAVNRYTRDASMENYINARKVQAKTRKTLRLKKKEGFQKFCESLNRESPIKIV